MSRYYFSKSTRVHVSAYNARWKKKSADDHFAILASSARRIPDRDKDHRVRPILFVPPSSQVTVVIFISRPPRRAAPRRANNFFIIIVSEQAVIIGGGNRLTKWDDDRAHFRVLWKWDGQRALDGFSKKTEMRLLRRTVSR